MTVAGAHESIAGLDMRIHVGFHRTGSTFLQQAVYPHLGKYLNIATQNTNGPLGYLARYFNFPRELGNAPYEKGYVDSSTTDAKGASLQQQLEAYFGAGPERAGKPFLLSNEDIVGPAFYCDHFGMPEQIARVFPRAKILLCIRSQFTIIPSIFNHNFSKVGTALYQRFVEALIKNEKLHYYTVIQRYREVFGIDAVTVVLFEELQTAPTEFVTRVLDFAGVPEAGDVAARIFASMETAEGRSSARDARNARGTLFRAMGEILINRTLLFDLVDISYRGRRLGSWRARLKHFLQIQLGRLERLNNRVGLLDPTPLESREKVKRLIADTYKTRNRELSRTLGRDLGSIGYPV